jgi:hypothetical protein
VSARPRWHKKPGQFARRMSGRFALLTARADSADAMIQALFDVLEHACEVNGIPLEDRHRARGCLRLATGGGDAPARNALSGERGESRDAQAQG